MSCRTCYRNIINLQIDKPPKYAISNNWCIGEIPHDIIDGDINEMLAAAIGKIRLFANVFSYTAGAHTAIKGNHVFFINDPEHVGATFEWMIKSGSAPEIYVMICGRVTPNQRELIRRRCTININEYKAIMNWLIDHHPSYSEMERPQSCPQPIFIGGFNETTNNTDESDNMNQHVEEIFDEEQFRFAPSHKPSESTGPFQSKINSYLIIKKKRKPTV